MVFGSRSMIAAIAVRQIASTSKAGAADACDRPANNICNVIRRKAKRISVKPAGWNQVRDLHRTPLPLPKAAKISTSRKCFLAEDTTIMLDAAVKALSQILSPPMRSILWRSIGLALVMVTVLAIGLQRLLSWLATSGEGWAEAMLGPGFQTPLNVLAWILSIAAGLGVVFGGILLMPAITSLIASVFVDDVAEHVEHEHYPAERPGVALPLGLALREGTK